QRRRRRSGEHCARPLRLAPRALRAEVRPGRPIRPARAPAADAGAAAGPTLRAQGDGAVPPLSRRARDLPLRPAPLRCIAARLDPRRLRLVATLPGDPREARYGLLR